ncbi:sigma-54-dependent transcriptional regulator [Breznakiellaceae bacterium SP9]
MKVLIVDDERNIRLSFAKFLGLEAIDSDCAESGERALEFLAKAHYDAVILDLKLPGMSGQEVLTRIRQEGIETKVIMISAHGQIADAVRSLKSGAHDYLVKPFDPADLVAKLKSLPLLTGDANGGLEAEHHGGFIGESPSIKELLGQIDKVARSDVTVLITGESGTGKEVTAGEIHARSPNSKEPFIAVNIGGIHEGLMESELFGHEKGSFTGAAYRKQGLFELAGKGSLFMDEIGEMPMPLQVKLLRVLQERKIRRLGGIIDIPVEARIISATNRNLESMVAEGRFREDLYFRLNVIRISLPPLRERAGDIPLLVRHFLARLGERMGRKVPCMTEAALTKLSSYQFPGNIRELENILERAIIYCENDTIEECNIDIHERSAELKQETASMFAIEKKAITETLERCKGNRTKTAAQLGISRKTLFNKMKEYGI